MELKKIINAFLIYSLIIILILLVYFFYKKYNSNLSFNNQLIPVKITLNNKCELIDDAFMVVSKDRCREYYEYYLPMTFVANRDQI